MTRQEKIQFVAVRSLGNFLVLFALYGVFATFGPALLHEIEFRIIQARGVEFTVAEAKDCKEHCYNDSSSTLVSPPSGGSEVETPQRGAGSFANAQSAPGFADILAGSKDQVLIPPNTQFSIIIPKLGASAKVFPNVDPGNPNEFLPLLQQGIAHAKGSVFPGMKGNTYLFAHSTDNWWHVGQYNAVFYLLKNLAPGDEIIVFFEDKRYTYVVSQSYIAEATDTTFLTRMPTDSQQLILQTCWPPGTTWKRLFVVAKPKT